MHTTTAIELGTSKGARSNNAHTKHTKPKRGNTEVSTIERQNSEGANSNTAHINPVTFEGGGAHASVSTNYESA